MKHDAGKIIVIGGGGAGLCAAVYAQRCGYQVEVLEMHDSAGGLATSWRRGEYTFETCLHWLFGSNPHGEMYSQWLEVFDIDKLTFVYPEEFVRLENEHGEHLSIYSNIDRLEKEMLRRAPQDAAEIRNFASAIRSLSKFKMPDPTEGWGGNWLTYLRDIPYLPLLHELSDMSSKEYGYKFTDPLIRAFFGEGDMGELSAIALFFSLAWMTGRDAGYPIGGSQAVIQGIAHKLDSLGGRLRLGTKVKRILVEDDIAVGVQLLDGETIAADWVISAADGHATIYELLGGKYTDKTTEEIYTEFETFPSYLQVSLGVALDLSHMPGFITRLLARPLHVDPSTQLRQISFRFFNFDPTFAPRGKTAVTCFLPTRNFEHWVHLQQQDSAGYQREKRRIAETVIAILEKMVPQIRSAIDVIDVSTPATVIQYTGNWKGSMEGWLLTTHHRVPAITKHSARVAAVPYGGPMDYAGRWATVRVANGALRYPGDMPTRPETFRESRVGDHVTRKGAFTVVALGIGGFAWIATIVSKVARRSFLSHIECLRGTLEQSAKALAVRIDIPPEVLELARRLGVPDDSGVRLVRLTQIGDMWLKPGSKPLDFSAVQTISAVEVGFLWRAWFRMAGVSMQVIDYIVAGEAGFEGRLLGALPVMHMTDTDATFRGEAMRYLAELIWNPDAILLNRRLTWRVLDEHTLQVATGNDRRQCEVRLILDEVGDPIRMEADDRPRQDGHKLANCPWFGRAGHYQTIGGRRIPTRAEAGWLIDGVEFVYWRGRVGSWSEET